MAKNRFTINFNGESNVRGMQVSPEFYEQQNGRFKILSREIAYATRFGLVVYHDEVLRPDGIRGIYGHVKLKSGVYVVPFDEDTKNVYLINNHIYPQRKRMLELITRGIDEDNPLDTAKRELKEEGGISAENWELLADVDPLDVVACHNKIYIATGLSIGKPKREPTEDMELVRMNLEEAVSLIGREITEGSTQIGLLLTYMKYNIPKARTV